MPRVTQSEVRVISGLTVDYAAAIEAAIPIASTLVTEKLTPPGILSEDTLRNIELFLAAHFAILSTGKGPLVGQKIETVSETYPNIYSAGLLSTQFGQQAVLLDSTGVLQAMAKNARDPKLTARFTHIEPAPFPEEDSA